MNSSAEGSATCHVIRSSPTYQGQQGPTYASGIGAESVGARAIWLGMATMPPGSRTRAHLHAAHETAIYVLQGEGELWFGEDLERHERVSTGDYLYIPAEVPHVAVNCGMVEPFVVVLARTDPREQESVVLLPDLDHRVP